MSTLHLLSQSPFSDNSLSDCLTLLNPEDGLLLSGNAVHICQSPAHLALLAALPDSIQLFALQDDLSARGLTPCAPVQAINYPRFVSLSLEFDKVNSWL